MTTYIILNSKADHLGDNACVHALVCMPLHVEKLDSPRIVRLLCYSNL